MKFSAFPVLAFVAVLSLHSLARAEEAGPAFKEMSHEQKKEFMKKVVLPKMKKLFTDFDNHYAEMKCVTCHGAGARDDSYKMPNPKLPKLPASKEGWDRLEEKHPEMFHFMTNTVKPTMAALLGMDQADPKTGKKFSCMNCHTKQE